MLLERIGNLSPSKDWSPKSTGSPFEMFGNLVKLKGYVTQVHLIERIDNPYLFHMKGLVT